MKEAMHDSGVSPAPAPRRQARRPRRIIRNCSICTKRIPYDAVAVMEPEGAEEPRQSWVLCQDCYQALIQEMHRSPVRTPLRLRIAARSPPVNPPAFPRASSTTTGSSSPSPGS